MATASEHLEQLSPPAPALDVSSGLSDAAARESVARLLVRPREPRDS